MNKNDFMYHQHTCPHTHMYKHMHGRYIHIYVTFLSCRIHVIHLQERQAMYLEKQYFMYNRNS